MGMEDEKRKKIKELKESVTLIWERPDRPGEAEHDCQFQLNKNMTDKLTFSVRGNTVIMNIWIHVCI